MLLNHWCAVVLQANPGQKSSGDLRLRLGELSLIVAASVLKDNCGYL
jgi:hypothetical protein